MNHLVLLFAILIIGMGVPPAFAHTTVHVEQFEIEVGWGIEPPVVGIRNDFVFQISESGANEGVKSGVINAFRNLEATAKFGGITKVLDINSDPRPGHYYSPVIPTKTGSILIDIKGEINGVPIDVEIPVEDVETTAVLDFPPSTGSSNQDVTSMKNAISSLQKEINSLKTGTGANLDNVGPAYDFAIFGLSLGAAGVILAVVAMIKRK